MNGENLKNGEPYRFKSGEKAAENGRKGGIASGKSKRKAKSMREAAKLVMSLQAPEEWQNILAAMGVPEDEATNQMAMMAAMAMQAMEGNTQAARFLRESTGDDPALQLRERELELKQSTGGGDNGPIIIDDIPPED